MDQYVILIVSSSPPTPTSRAHLTGVLFVDDLLPSPPVLGSRWCGVPFCCAPPLALANASRPRRDQPRRKAAAMAIASGALWRGRRPSEGWGTSARLWRCSGSRESTFGALTRANRFIVPRRWQVDVASCCLCYCCGRRRGFDDNYGRLRVLLVARTGWRAAGPFGEPTSAHRTTAVNVGVRSRGRDSKLCRLAPALASG